MRGGDGECLFVLDGRAWSVVVVGANVVGPGNSSINWSTTHQNIANGLSPPIVPTGKVKIGGRSTPTDVVIDIHGILL